MEDVSYRMTFKVVIVGCGRIAGLFDSQSSSQLVTSHASAYRNNGNFELSGCVDIDQNIGRLFAKEHSIPHSSQDLLSIIELVKPDVVSVTTPDATHFQVVRQIVEHNRFPPRIVFVEKPVCTKEDELLSLIKLTRKSTVPIIVNHSRRFNPFYKNLKKDFEQFKFGELLGVESTYYGGWLHSGVHVVDTLRFLFSREFRSAKIIESIPSKSIADPTITIKADLGSDNVPVWFKGWRDDHYQIFDFEFRFSLGRLRIANFEQQITWERSIVNLLKENVLVPADLQGKYDGGASMENAVQLIYKYLLANDLTVLDGYLLDDVAPTMTTLWQFKV